MKLEIASDDRCHAILVCDDAHNDIAEFFHNEHATVSQSYETALALAKRLVEGSSGVAQGVQPPADGNGYSGPFSATEFNERAWDHERAVKNGLSAGPNVSYVRTFQACAAALRYAAKHMPFEADASSVPSTSRCTCAAIVNPNIPHARTCPLSSTVSNTPEGK